MRREGEILDLGIMEGGSFTGIVILQLQYKNLSATVNYARAIKNKTEN